MEPKHILKNHLHSTDGFVRLGPLMAIPSILREFGQEPKGILAESNFKLTQFADPDFETTYQSVGKLVARCVAITGCEHFGLLAGQRATPSAFGVAGFMLQNSPDVGTALRDFAQHLGLHDQGGVVVLQTLGHISLVGYAIQLPDVEAADQIYDLSIAIGCNFMRSMCGESWNPDEVLLTRPPPQDIAPLSQFFRAPLHFNAVQNALVFPTKWLNHHVPGADALLHQYLEKEAARLHGKRETNFVVKVRELLHRSILARQCTVANIAAQLCLHERTLHRRLREHNTTFRRISEEVRSELARQLLSETTMSIKSISATLGYSDTSAFNHAFKRWTGDTPTHWRERVKAPQPARHEKKDGALFEDNNVWSIGTAAH